ncbi:MAG: S9 family peptidase [Bacteroidales bacterium]|nr:S9 family peptidase [Bacteroidales bacterium]MCF8391072.1 S9 family peptidase [Bacteroidales bacterium]
MKRMSTLPLFLTLVLFLMTLNSCKNKELIQPAKQYAVEDFFKNPEKVNYLLSPDGKYYAYMAPYMDRLNVYVQEIGSENVIRLTSDTARSIAGYFWANNNRILYLKDSGGDENFKLFGVDIDGSNLVGLTDFDKVNTNIIDDLPEIEDYVIVGLNKRNAQVFDPYRLNINTGELSMLAENPGNIVGWLTDHNGKLRMATAIVDGVNTSILYRETEEDMFNTILTTSFKETMSPFFFTFDNKNVYASSNLGRDKAAIVVFDPNTGEEVEVLYENPDFDVDMLFYSKKRKVLTTARYASWKLERHFFDTEFEEMIHFLESKLVDTEIGIVSTNKAEDKAIVIATDDKSMGTYYLYDKQTGSIDKIADIAPWLDKNEMASMVPIKYESRDSLTINGYLTLPKGYTMKNARDLPVVVNPHGGPWYRDTWGFNPEVQFLANKGYAVFQMNFRGSTGYGKEFWEASFKQWGKNMQNDITDGVNWLIDKGIADEERIAIYGGSYGGYATLAGVTFTPDLYAAAIDYVGVSNLFTFMNTIPPYWKPLLDMLYEMVGDPVKDSILLREASPVFHVDKITTPLFVAQGANDPRVNIEESNQMVEALKKRGIVVDYMVKDNEGHGFYNEENRFDFYNAMEKFLDEHLNKEVSESEL